MNGICGPDRPVETFRVCSFEMASDATGVIEIPVVSCWVQRAAMGSTAQKCWIKMKIPGDLV